MTVKLMARFGVKVELLNGLNHMRVRAGGHGGAEEAWHFEF